MVNIYTLNFKMGLYGLFLKIVYIYIYDNFNKTYRKMFELTDEYKSRTLKF